MNKNVEFLHLYSWHCPNCGCLLSGYKNQCGKIQVFCNHCKAISIRKEMGRRHSTIDVYLPKEE